MSAFARLMGSIFRVESKHGTRQDGSPWRSTNVHVLVDGAGITEVNLFDEDLGKLGGVQPRVGDKIDWLIEVSQGARGLRVSVLDDLALSAARVSNLAAVGASSAPASKAS